MSRLIQKNFMGYKVDIFMIDRLGNEPRFTNVVIEEVDEFFMKVKMFDGKYQLVGIREVETIREH